MLVNSKVVGLLTVHAHEICFNVTFVIGLLNFVAFSLFLYASP